MLVFQKYQKYPNNNTVSDQYELTYCTYFELQNYLQKTFPITLKY